MTSQNTKETVKLSGIERYHNPEKRPVSKQEMQQIIKKEANHLPSKDRRSFLRKASTLGAFTVLTPSFAKEVQKKIANPDNLPPNVPSWQKHLGTGVVTDPYGSPSKFESSVVRRTVPWLTADSISSISFSPIYASRGMITPNGLFFERYHGGLAQVPPQDYRLMIHGLVERPLIFSLEDLMRMPTISKIHFIECPANTGMEWRGSQMEASQFTHGMVSCAEWTGIKLSTLLGEVGLKPQGKWLLVEGSDAAAMTRSIPLEKALDDALLVYAQNGEMLRPEQGYPVRLLLPGWEGNTSVKWLRRIEVGDKPWHMREETSKYTDLLPSGKARRFTWAMACKSVITSPSPENKLHAKGQQYLQGLAWSGRGKIKRVDVSFDGGINWQTADLTSLVLDKAMTRFGLSFQWNGEPMLIQSRAIDENNYVQPTISQLRAVRGVQSIYHNHAIQTWKIEPSGEVKNVQIA